MQQSAAQQITVDQYKSTVRTTDGFVIDRPDFSGLWGYGYQFQLDYANDPLVVENYVDSEPIEAFSVVRHELVGRLNGSLGVGHRAMIFAGLLFNVVMSGDDDPLDVYAADGAGVGDLYLGGRMGIVSNRAYRLAVQAALRVHPRLPRISFAGGDGYTLHPQVLFETHDGPMRFVANLGARLRNQQVFQSVTIGNELTYAVGVIVPLEHRYQMKLDGHLELFGATTLADFRGREESPAELLAGVKAHPRGGGPSWGLAGGFGLSRGLGAPDFRVVVMLGWDTAAGY